MDAMTRIRRRALDWMIRAFFLKGMSFGHHKECLEVIVEEEKRTLSRL